MAIKPTSQVFTILGCGSSHGVPRADGDWGRIRSQQSKKQTPPCEPLDRKIRPNGQEKTVVINTGPDFRDQMISARVKYIDAVIYTHGHADHTHGMGDLRAFAMAHRKRVQIHSDSATLNTLEESFGYCLKSQNGSFP